MAQGIPGEITRVSASVVEGQPLNSSLPFSAYGLPVKIVSGKVVPITNTGDVVWGFLSRPFPITGANASDPLGTSVPPTTGVANVMRRGYMSVFVQNGAASAALGSAVYIRFQNPGGGKIVGGLEASSSGDTYQLTNAAFMGPADANGNAEISWGSPTL
jgi:hypothetical protein